MEECNGIFEKNKKFVAWDLLVTLVLIPLFIQVLIHWDTMNNGLGFWGWISWIYYWSRRSLNRDSNPVVQ